MERLETDYNPKSSSGNPVQDVSATKDSMLNNWELYIYKEEQIILIRLNNFVRKEHGVTS